MLEIIAVSLICGTFYGDPDLDSAFIDHITVYVNKSDAYDNKLEVVTYYIDSLSQKNPWESNNEITTTYKVYDNGTIKFQFPYEIEEGDGGMVRYTINSETLKFSQEYWSFDDDISTENGYCIKLNEIPN